jgi:molecular chaperone DnaJ
MALKYHPDKNADVSASEKFRQAKMAYEVLNEEETRRAYDFETRLEGRGRYNI